MRDLAWVRPLRRIAPTRSRSCLRGCAGKRPSVRPVVIVIDGADELSRKAMHMRWSGCPARDSCRTTCALSSPCRRLRTAAWPRRGSTSAKMLWRSISSSRCLSPSARRSCGAPGPAQQSVKRRPVARTARGSDGALAAEQATSRCTSLSRARRWPAVRSRRRRRRRPPLRQRLYASAGDGGDAEEDAIDIAPCISSSSQTISASTSRARCAPCSSRC